MPIPFSYIAIEFWRWLADTGINLALLVLLALLVPRAGRFMTRMAERRARESADPDEAKSQLAIAGVGIYIAQTLAYFLILVFFLQQVGFSLAGAAIPATVVSAAIGFGAQNVIADFVAGFFILTEKQYGVGDNVTFEGNGISITGDVIQITMRATQIRTLEQSTVSIPNSTARICINQSNYWSSAVVVIPVPLLGSESADEAVARSEAAARRALSRPDIRSKVLGELAIHPAVEVNPPATVGMPWTVDMRFIVRVEPLAQWMVERTIRLSVLNEFWDEYGSATTIQGTRLDRVVEHSQPFLSTDTATDTDTDTEALTRVQPAVSDPYEQPPVDPDEDPAAEDTAEDEKKPPPRTVFGGAMRLSTFNFIAAFVVLIILRGLTLGSDDATQQTGILAPPPRSTASETSEVPEPSATSTTPASSEQSSETASGTATATEPSPVPTNPNSGQDRPSSGAEEPVAPTPREEPTGVTDAELGARSNDDAPGTQNANPIG